VPDGLARSPVASALAATTQLVWLVPLLPCWRLRLIAAGLLLRRGGGDAGEPLTAAMASAAALGALLLLLVFDLAALGGAAFEPLVFGEWLRIGAMPVRLSFVLDAYSLPAATLVALIAWMALRFSATYLHRESGFPRFFLGMCLFLAGMLLIVLAGNAVLPSSAGNWPASARGCSSPTPGSGRWRPATRCSSSSPTASATPASCSASASRCGRWAPSSGSGWPATAAWARSRPPAGGRFRAGGAGQVGATAIHALDRPCARRPDTVVGGVLRLADGARRRLPALSSAGTVAAGARPAGAAGRRRSGDALYGGLCALVQSDVKSALIFSTVTQVGLMFFCCGLGLFWLAVLFRPACGLACLPVPARTGVHAPGASPGAAGCRAGWPRSAGATPRRCSASGSSRWPTAC
jgi:hypothetical protein